MINKLKKRISVALLLAMAVSALFPFTASAAINTPDTMEVNQVEVYRNTLESLDQLYLITYTLEYTGANPTEGSASELFLCRLMDGATQLGSAVPYDYFDDGYSTGIMSIYFSAEDVTTLGMGWGVATGYTIQLQANPTLSWTDDPPPSVGTSDFSLWYDETTTFATSERLTTRIRALATLFTTAWALSPLSLIEDIVGSKKLTTYGEDYFTTSIQNLRIICPELFSTSMAPAETLDQALVQDMYVISDDNAYDAFGATWLAQTFRATGSYTTTGTKLKLLKVGNPGQITVSLRASAAGMPTGADLVTGTIDGNLVSSYLQGSWYDVYFTTEVDIVEDTYYAIVLRATGGNANNYIQWRVDTESAYIDGQACASADSGATWAIAVGAPAPSYPSPLIDTTGVVDSSPLIGVSGLTSTNLLIGGGILSQNFMFSMQGWQTQTAVYAEILEGRLIGGKFDMTPLARAFGLPLVWVSSLVWLVISILIAVGITRFTGSYKPGALTIVLLMPLGALMGFVPLVAAILVAMIGGGAIIYVFFYRSAA